MRDIGIDEHAASLTPGTVQPDARTPVDPDGYELGRFGPVFPATTPAASTGMPGWQITLIALGAALAAAAVTIVLARAWAAHRTVPSPAV